ESFGISNRPLEREEANALEPALLPVFSGGVHWTGAVSVSDPLAVTKAYVARFGALGGVTLSGNANRLHRHNGRRGLRTEEGFGDGREGVVALGPWAPDVLSPLGIKLPLGFKRGYHRHFRPKGNAVLTRPVLDADVGYVLAPMEQGIRVTTGVEFAARDAPPTPVQLARLMPAASAMFPLGEPVEATPWMGSRPTFPDSRPV